MMLSHSKNDEIRENPPKILTYWKLNAETEVDDAIDQLKHQDMVGSIQTKRGGLGTTSYKPFCLNPEKEKRDNMINKVKHVE